MIFERSFCNLLPELGISFVDEIWELDYQSITKYANFECGIPAEHVPEALMILLDGPDQLAEWLDEREDWRA